MRLSCVSWVAGLFAALVVSSGFGTSRTALADPISEGHLLAVSISFGASEATENSDEWRLGGDLGIGDVLGLAVEAEHWQSILPDSMRFSGLAGALNLAIDDSGDRPLVHGIELAPRETLRISAGKNSRLGGIQGQISIRLDF